MTNREGKILIRPPCMQIMTWFRHTSELGYNRKLRQIAYVDLGTKTFSVKWIHKCLNRVKVESSHSTCTQFEKKLYYYCRWTSGIFRQLVNKAASCQRWNGDTLVIHSLRNFICNLLDEFSLQFFTIASGYLWLNFWIRVE